MNSSEFWNRHDVSAAMSQLTSSELSHYGDVPPYRAFLRAMKALDTKGKTLFDFGCGCGGYGVVAQKEFPGLKYVCWDVCESMREQAAQRGMTVVQPDACDFLLLSCTLEYDDNPPQALIHWLTKGTVREVVILHRVRFHNGPGQKVPEGSYFGEAVPIWFWNEKELHDLLAPFEWTRSGWESGYYTYIIKTRPSREKTLVTLFDRNYLCKGLTMLESAARFTSGRRLIACTLDDDARTEVTRLMGDKVSVLAVDELNWRFPELVETKNNRKYPEWCFTLTPFVMRFCAENFGDDVLYVDADSVFFDDATVIEQEGEHHAASIVHHRWTPKLAYELRIRGEYNVGVIRARFPFAHGVIADWMDWCITMRGREPDGRFTDQLHLNLWPQFFGVDELKHPGINLAPWSQEQYEYRVENGKLKVQNLPVVHYHFHGFYMTKEQERWSVYEGNPYYQLKNEIREHMYRPYELKLREWLARLNITVEKM